MNMTSTIDITDSLNAVHTTIKQCFQNKPAPSYNERIAHLKALKSAVLNQQQALITALRTDYSHRANTDTVMGDVMPVINNINYTLKQLKSWMKPSKRHAGMLLSPAKVSVHYQPLGVIGIIAPWNFPVMLSLGPLISAIAAGNRAMIKLSEFTPATNTVLNTIVSSVFDEDYVCIVEGEADVAAAFSALPFDHILFTGSTMVGRHVMAAAAKNLTPVTLELGGKSPVIVAPDASMDLAVDRLIYGKCFNAAQICIAPDYVLLPKGCTETFKQTYKDKFISMYGTSVNNNDDYGSIINTRQFDRLQHVIEDAKTKGAVVESVINETVDPQKRKLATQLVTHVNDDMAIMQEEIFGPLLPIVEYEDLDEAIAYVNNRPRPLALYIMSFDNKTQEKILKNTHSGGVGINDTLSHVGADDAPFGGVGSSGMGHYHGKEGFLTMSHAKTVLKRGKINSAELMQAPYGKSMQKFVMSFFVR